MGHSRADTDAELWDCKQEQHSTGARPGLMSYVTVSINTTETQTTPTQHPAALHLWPCSPGAPPLSGASLLLGKQAVKRGSRDLTETPRSEQAV